MFDRLVSALRPGRPPFLTGGHSVAGRKPVNEDSYLIETRKDACLLLVADGVGGHGHGDWASQACVRLFREAFLGIENLNDPGAFLTANALRAAHAVLQQHDLDPDYKHCGTTLTGFLVQDGHYHVINIGDSRSYAWRAATGLRRLTKDHSLVQQMMDAGTLTEAEAATHPYRTTMTSAIGQPLDTMRIDLAGPHPLAPDELLLAFSDGIHDYLTDAQIAATVAATPAETLAKTLVEQALAAGSTDNVTACWLRTA